MRRVLVLGLLLATAPQPPAGAAEVLPGPLPAQVLTVLDGDTLEVAAYVWLDQVVKVKVRLAGIDTPEIRSRCLAERDAGKRARRFLAQLVYERGVVLRDIRYGKYAGRVLARVETADGLDLAEALIAKNLARPYDGGKRAPWCAAAD